MEQCLFILLFFTGVIPLVLSVPRKYYLIQQGKTWSDAQAYCRATHTDLAIIQSTDNMIRFQNEVQRQQFTSSAWIGMYLDIHSWHWSLGNESLAMTLWCAGEPNNSGGNQRCGAVNVGCWFDAPCDWLLAFVCFDATKTGNNRYVYISTTMSWPDAQIYCRTYYTDLASDRDATEDTALTPLIPPAGAWLGLVRDNWMWTDQTNLSTISWMPGKPDNALGNENCGYLNNNQAADAQCSNIMPFFCYRVITGQQEIIRVKVRSNQDVNGPAVNVAILDQIKQKLKAHGNITVSWREQPDGKVFHKEKGNNTTENTSSKCLWT